MKKYSKLFILMVKINQKDNYEANFGFFQEVVRILRRKTYKNKLVLSNYWSFKNNIKVFLVVSYRKMNGDLVKENINLRERCSCFKYTRKLIGS